jgi:hypothetical protein
MIAKPSKISNANRRSRIDPQTKQNITRFLTVAEVVLITFPLVLIGIYCAELPAGGLMAFGAAVMVSAASFLSGALLGFLFG